MGRTAKHYSADRDIQSLLGSLLKTGVMLSTAIIMFGGIIYLVRHTNDPVSFEHFNPDNVKFNSFVSIFIGLRNFEPLAIIQFGIVLLISTPLARILFSVFGFLIEKDYLYVAIGLIVLVIILMSLYLDIAH